MYIYYTKRGTHTKKPRKVYSISFKLNISYNWWFIIHSNLAQFKISVNFSRWKFWGNLTEIYRQNYKVANHLGRDINKAKFLFFYNMTDFDFWRNSQLSQFFYFWSRNNTTYHIVFSKTTGNNMPDILVCVEKKSKNLGLKYRALYY